MQKKLLVGLCLAGLLQAPLAMANDIAFPHLETRGVSEIVATPDQATISVAVVVQDKSAKKAKDASDKAVAAFIQRLTHAGVAQDAIRSANIQLQPQYRYQKDKPAILDGYRAVREVKVEVKQLDNLNNILDSALDKGMNRINNIEFSSSKEAELKQQARMAAIKDAQQKAKSLARGFGEKLDGVWEIRYFEQQPVRNVMMRSMAMDESRGIDQSYQNGQVTYRDSVEVVYKLKD